MTYVTCPILAADFLEPATRAAMALSFAAMDDAPGPRPTAIVFDLRCADEDPLPRRVRVRCGAAGTDFRCIPAHGVKDPDLARAVLMAVTDETLLLTLRRMAEGVQTDVLVELTRDALLLAPSDMDAVEDHLNRHEGIDDDNVGELFRVLVPAGASNHERLASGTRIARQLAEWSPRLTSICEAPIALATPRTIPGRRSE